MEHNKLYAAIDAGGTTFKCGIVTSNGQVLAYEQVMTGDPLTTYEECLAFFKKQEKAGRVFQSLGIACFGPLDRDKNSAAFGLIHNTVKEGWDNANPYKWFSKNLDVKVDIETDVNAALLAEREWGAAMQSNTSAYITIGTGIGAGIYANNGLLAHPYHPEFGHIPVEKHPLDNEFYGICSFHKNCLEGMASAPSIWRRFGDPKSLPHEHLAWVLVSDYLAQACQTLIFSIRPEKIVLGGGLMQSDFLIQRIRQRVGERLNHYAGISSAEIDSIIVGASLGYDAGLLGAAWVTKNARCRSF